MKKILDREPGEEMQDAARKVSDEYPYKPQPDGQRLSYLQTSLIWRAMHDAAPAVPVDEEAVRLLRELVDAITPEVNEKGAGGYLLARMSDAREFLAAKPAASGKG